MVTKDANSILADSLGKIVGSAHVLPASEARTKYASDQWWYAIAAAASGEAISKPDVAVSPTTPEQVAQVIKLANNFHVPVTPWGGGSGVQGAANADQGGIILDLKKLNRVRSINRQSLTCVVEAGKICKLFEEELNADGYSFTHYPASTEWATIGGSIAARGSGVLSTKYGKIEDHILSLEFVTPMGELVTTPAVPRHAVGPELTQLLIGAEGTLGVVTAATVKLHHLPKQRTFVVAAFPTLKDGVEAGRIIMTSGLKPAVMRLYDAEAAAHSLARAVETDLQRTTLVMMFDGEYPELVKHEAQIAQQICQDHHATMLSENIGAVWWDKRYVFYYPPYAPELPSIWGTIDVVADFEHIEAVYAETTQAIRAACPAEFNLSLNTHFSHWYEWGSMIYARMKIPTGPADLSEAKELHDTIFRAGVEAAMKAGAVMNDHHGVGMRLAPFMPAQYGAGMDSLRRIKKALDPNNILCPGKLGL